MNMVLCTQEDDRTMAGRIHKMLNKTIMMKRNITVDVFQTYIQETPTIHALSRA
jgi:hypothetical protein